jgi:hypothetical protein
MHSLFTLWNAKFKMSAWQPYWISVLKSCRKMCTIFSTVLPHQRKTDVMTYFGRDPLTTPYKAGFPFQQADWLQIYAVYASYSNTTSTHKQLIHRNWINSLRPEDAICSFFADWLRLISSLCQHSPSRWLPIYLNHNCDDLIDSTFVYRSRQINTRSSHGLITPTMYVYAKSICRSITIACDRLASFYCDK